MVLSSRFPLQRDSTRKPQALPPLSGFNLAVGISTQRVPNSKGGVSQANRGKAGSVANLLAARSFGSGQSPDNFALSNARMPVGLAYATGCRAFSFASMLLVAGFAGAGRSSSRLAPDYLQNCHQGRVGAAFKAVCANSRCNSPICTSLASNCALSTSTSSFESLLGISWISVGMSSGIRTTHLPLSFRPLSTLLANLRRIVLTLTSRCAAASMIVMFMCSRVLTLSTRCLLKTHKALTTAAA